MIKLSLAAPGRLRALAAAIFAAATLGTLAAGTAVPPSAAWADTGSPSGSTVQSSLQLQAQELAAQIQADGRRLDQMAEAVNAAEIRSKQLDTQLSGLDARMSATTAKADAARAELKRQAVLSYVVGGAPSVGSIPGGGSDPSVALSYAEILTGSQKRALEAYRSVLAEQAGELQQIDGARRDAAVNLAQLVAERSAAATADSARQQALARVSGQLAVLVAQIQAAQQAAARAAIVARSPVANSPATTTPPTTSAPSRHSNPSSRPSPLQTTRPPSAPATSTPRQSPTTTAGASSGSPQPPGSPSPQAPGANRALAYARAQLGKPYQWGAAGPDSFDCSGLTMMAWRQGGVSFPHLAQDQYDMTQRISISQALPGDLIFFGTPSNVYHVGIYVGNGQMIDAPETGQNVSVQSIYWSDLLGAGRVTG